jgi:hypothetical protein
VAWRRIGDDRHDALQHLGDARRGDAVIAMPPLLDAGDETAVGELAEMPARRLRRHARGVHEFARG